VKHTRLSTWRAVLRVVAVALVSAVTAAVLGCGMMGAFHTAYWFIPVPSSHPSEPDWVHIIQFYFSFFPALPAVAAGLVAAVATALRLRIRPWPWVLAVLIGSGLIVALAAIARPLHPSLTSQSLIRTAQLLARVVAALPLGVAVAALVLTTLTDDEDTPASRPPTDTGQHREPQA
jgi:hypothetical protein